MGFYVRCIAQLSMLETNIVDEMMKNISAKPQFKLFKRHAARRYKQTGAVLVTGVIFLVVLTMLVLSIMRSATLEERMAANARNRQIALQAAEAVIRDAEENLLQELGAAAPIEPMNDKDFTDACTNGFCSTNVDRWESIDWDNAGITRTFKTPASGDPFSIAGVTSQPRYYVEQIGITKTKECPLINYRITARGVGPDSSTVVLQTNFRRQPSEMNKKSSFTQSHGGNCIIL